ncbi:MAG: response regulator [Candidatus Cloacimonetes bacterium]|nr:response regulator [Candidatus Cloacimonadota bacterium]
MLKILIVEDERMIAEDIKLTLVHFNYKVIGIISKGEDALKKLEKLAPDLILMDIMLNGKLNGIETGAIITNKYDIPIIFLTAYADDKTIDQATSASPYGFILKPFDSKEIHAVIEMAMVKHKAKKVLEESRAKFESMFQGNPEPSVYIDNDYKIVDINPRFTEYFLYTKEEVKDKYIDDLIVPEESQMEAKDLNVKTLQSYVYYDTLRKRKDGVLVPVSISAAPIMIKGKAAGSFVIYKDISKQKKAETEREKVIADLKQALEKVKTLSGLVPICSHCKKIRDDSGYWQKVEEYISQYSDVDFSHSICPECLQKHYPKQYEKMKEKGTLPK